MLNRSKPHLVLAAALASLLASPALAAPPAVKVADAWCRATPKGAPSGGCYLTLTAVAADRLVAVETTAAKRGEIHTMDMAGDVMRMRRLTNGIALPPGEAVVLKPGGPHLMIIGPAQQLVAGGAVPLTLKFAKAPPLTVKALVRATPISGAQ